MKRPFLLGIGGAHSGTGKTTVASALLRHLTGKGGGPSAGSRPPSGEAPSASPAHRPLPPLPGRWGAIKYTRTSLYTSVVDDPGILSQKDKDTALLLAAGAEEVLWVQSPPEELHEVLPQAVERLSFLDGIVIEGNSAIEFLKPDIVLFIVSVSGKTMKSSAHEILHHADIVVIPESRYERASHRVQDEGTEAAPPPEACATVVFAPSDGSSLRELIRCLAMTVQKKSIEQLLKERAADNVISCARARGIAEELGVPYREVGKAADALRIKIKNGELGCC
ncbi:MAG: hypothetical protein U0411_00915 [Thermodesulfovibrionales bacterium]